MIVQSGRILEGLGLSPGAAIARIDYYDRARKLNLQRRLTDLEVVGEMQNLLAAVTVQDLATFQRNAARSARDKNLTSAHWVVLRAVERVLRERGGGLESALAFVLEGHGEGLDHVERATARPGLDALSDLTERVLTRLIASQRARNRDIPESYIAFSEHFTLAEAMNLPPGLVGVVAETGNHWQLSQLGRLLGIPVVSDLSGTSDFIQEGALGQLDGSRGSLLLHDPSKEEPTQ